MAAVALLSSSTKSVARHAATLAAEVHDPKLARVLGAGAVAEPVEPVVGEMASPPRGPLATTLLAVTGILLVMQAAR